MSLPPLPKIEGDVDLLLDVFTHGSLRYGQNVGMNDEYGDTDRLAELGNRILDLAVTFHYFSKRPIISATDVAVRFPGMEAYTVINLNYSLLFEHSG